MASNEVTNVSIHIFHFTVTHFLDLKLSVQCQRTEISKLNAEY